MSRPKKSLSPARGHACIRGRKRKPVTDLAQIVPTKPYVVPQISTWKRRMLCERDITDALG